ncbi:hypothetical protein SAY87_016424 [Trapa incisa]|uniref:Pectinesterase inhibitor domain-containing protein n=1 Tax=Trapa incisa TaxID=236973 RepID=A0AAN7QZ26_9MYRT|nr:hypothetical protein SAY87_016424 [Trapa incisa]
MAFHTATIYIKGHRGSNLCPIRVPKMVHRYGFSLLSPLLLLLLLLVVFITLPPASAKRAPSSPSTTHTTPISPVPRLVQKTCKTTKYYDLCVSSLRSDPRSPSADTKGLALIMIGVATTNATATSSFLSSLAVSTTTVDPALVKLLRDCAGKYSLSGSSLQDSAQDLAAESYDEAYLHIMAAQDYPNACHNAFRQPHGQAYPPEIAQREDGLKRICDVALSIVDILASQK